ncbi:hypothetical protein K9N50_13410 [bacterium]|nr:hypothetical protein [bacterium]
MNLLDTFLYLTEQLDSAFSQKRTHIRGCRMLLSNLLCAGRHWISRVISLAGRMQLDWSADYRLFSRSPWKSSDIFEPAIKTCLDISPAHGPICLLGDETKIKRSGRKVKLARWMRDPLSPPFHTNFIKGFRALQFTFLLPLDQIAQVTARSIPILFEPIFSVLKPSRKASQQTWDQYNKARRKNTLCDQAVNKMQLLRQVFDRLGAATRPILFALDGGFCNKKVFKAALKGCYILARCRKDVKLCFRSQDPDHKSRVYAPEKWTPKSVYKDSSIPWQKGLFFIGGQYRKLGYKVIDNLLWQTGAGKKPLRLIVLAPTPYRLSPNSRLNYRQPAFLLTDALDMDINFLIRCYINRWQIEVNNRDEKQHIGIQDPQVWNDKSVDRLPAFLVASYSYLLLASLLAYGPKRTDDYLRPPKWQRRRTRPSCLDLICLLRKQASDNPQRLESLEINFSALSTLASAA